MKNTDLAVTSVSQFLYPMKSRPFPNGSSGRVKNYSGKNMKVRYEHPRMSRKVHANINFSKLDEVCLDVGKVDLSHSAKLRSDTGLSPHKPCDTNGEVQEVSFSGVNGHADGYTVYVKNRVEFERVKTIRSCYVQLEDLGPPKKGFLGKSSHVADVAHSNAEDGGWKGWSSNIVFSNRHGCPIVKTMESTEISEVMIMTEDLVAEECKILESTNGHRCYRGNFRKLLGVSSLRRQKNKSLEERKKEIKNKIEQFFLDPEELNCFLESLECSLSSPKKTFSRRIDFHQTSVHGSRGTLDVSTTHLQRRTNENIVGDLNSDAYFCGFSESAIHLADEKSRQFLEYYAKFKKDNEFAV